MKWPTVGKLLLLIDLREKCPEIKTTKEEQQRASLFTARSWISLKVSRGLNVTDTQIGFFFFLKKKEWRNVTYEVQKMFHYQFLEVDGFKISKF